MGGAAPEPSGKGAKKALDAHINLVPYIDLLMTIMTFLVMTAVWTQIATLEVQNAAGGNPPEEQEKEDEDKPKPIIVLLTADSIKVQEEGGELKEIAKIGNDILNDDFFDMTNVEVELKRLKEARPERVEVKVQAEDGIPYKHIVGIIDMATGLKLTGLTLTPAQGS